MTGRDETSRIPLPVGVSAEVFNTLREILYASGPVDNAYLYLGHDGVDEVLATLLLAALPQSPSAASDEVSGEGWQPLPQVGDPLGHDYHPVLTNAEAQAKAVAGHGWVRGADGGRKAKCGGFPACGVCRLEDEMVQAGLLA